MILSQFFLHQVLDVPMDFTLVLIENAVYVWRCSGRRAFEVSDLWDFFAVGRDMIEDDFTAEGLMFYFLCEGVCHIATERALRQGLDLCSRHYLLILITDGYGLACISGLHGLVRPFLRSESLAEVICRPAFHCSCQHISYGIEEDFCAFGLVVSNDLRLVLRSQHYRYSVASSCILKLIDILQIYGRELIYEYAARKIAWFVDYRKHP